MNKVMNISEMKQLDLGKHLWKQDYVMEEFAENTIYTNSKNGICGCIKIENEEQFDYLLRCLDNLSDKQKLLYRGQRNIHWFLVSTLEREIHKIPHHKITTKLYEEIANKVYEETIKINRFPFLLSKDDFQNKVDVFSIGQHYGLHTPLMDWTKSFDIALFFSKRM